MSNSTLREIGEDLQALEDLLAEVGGDVSEAEAEAAIDAWLMETTDALHKKLDRYADLIQYMNDRAKGRKEEAARLTALAKTDENGAKYLKDRLYWFMKEHGQAKLDTKFHRLSIAKAGGKAPVVITTDMTPQQAWDEGFGAYVRVCYEWDKVSILNGLELGAKGAGLIAKLGERSESVKIK
jgi:hypothetical protein